MLQSPLTVAVAEVVFDFMKVYCSIMFKNSVLQVNLSFQIVSINKHKLLHYNPPEPQPQIASQIQNMTLKSAGEPERSQ